MRVGIGYLLVLVCIVFSACSKKYADYSAGSGFDRAQIDRTTLENLEVLGRVWGYVKYHHPAFADKKYDLDFELFELLPQVADAEPAERNRILASWIDGFGKFRTAQEKYDAIMASESLYDYRTDVGWICDTARLGAELSERLVRLRVADRKGNYYVSPTMSVVNGIEYRVGNPCFDNEKPYAELSNPDYGYRLLGVFRFWNMVEYYFPTKYLTDKDWNDVLGEYIGRMVHPVDEDYRKEVWRMIAETNDNHAQWNRVALFGEYRAALHTGFIEGKLLVISPDTIPSYNYERLVPFEVGDEIVTVDGKPVDHYISQVREFIPCSNQNDVLGATADIILRSKNNRQLRVRYIRNSMQRDTVLAGMERMGTFENRYLDKRIEASKMLGDSIGYIYPAKYTGKNKDRIAKMLLKTQGLVIDLRCYPTQEFAEFLTTYIIPNDLEIDIAVATYPQYDLPGAFFTRHPSKQSKETETEKYKGNIVVLVNETTQSYAETSVQVMQCYTAAKVIGSPSAGANGNISFFIFPGNIESSFSGLGWYYPDGWCVQRQGVKIDLQVPRTTEGIKAGRDEILETAIKIIRKETEAPENLRESKGNKT